MSQSISFGQLFDEQAVGLLQGAPWRRFVVLGDSLAEGVEEHTVGYPTGGWAATVARVLRRVNPALVCLNLGRRDLLAGEVRATQLRAALEFGPDLTVIVCGGNDLPLLSPMPARASPSVTARSICA